MLTAHGTCQTISARKPKTYQIGVGNLRYLGSQSWPFPNSLMLGFHAEYDSGEITLQQEEIADAQWFHYSDLPNKPAMMSISGWLIADYIKRMETR